MSSQLLEIDTRPLTIVLVDDDDGEAKAVTRAFRASRILNRIVRTRDGIEALALLRGETAVHLDGPVILLLDINMPRMNGHEFLAELRKDPRLRATVIFMLTTSTAVVDVNRAHDHNVAGYVVKERAGTEFIDLISALESYWKVVELPENREGVVDA